MSLLSSAILGCCEKMTKDIPLEMDVDSKTWATFVQKQVSHAIDLNDFTCTQLTLSERLSEKYKGRCRENLLAFADRKLWPHEMAGKACLGTGRRLSQNVHMGSFLQRSE